MEDPVTFALPDEARNAPDHLLFVQQFDLTTTQNIERQSYQENNINNGLGSTGLSEYRLVNGMYQPTLTMKPNEWQRWRVVYGAWDAGALNLEVDTGCEMALLAKDSIYISDFPRIITQAAIPPGGRADIMVRCDDTATSYTVTHFNGDTLFTIDMEAVGVTATDLPSWSLPLPDYLEDVLNEPVDNACNCETALEGGSLTINGQDFDPTVFIHTVELGKAVERTVRGIGAHPYHQHVYPFQLVDNINDNTGYFQRGDWHDVIMMTGFAQTNIRYLPTRFLGRLMLHCHRLDHEDRVSATCDGKVREKATSLVMTHLLSLLKPLGNDVRRGSSSSWSGRLSMRRIVPATRNLVADGLANRISHSLADGVYRNVISYWISDSVS